ncbi:uncharacterized protein LOC142559449 [Dermacentor variabilis]|uniref:uncharacterized protein LOC142559449 n=1 Tax=Dermacentor variabilis TaxID=34621 RepID=UPI003F5CB4F8
MVPSPGFRFHAGVHGAGSSCCVRALPGSPIARPGAGELWSWVLEPYSVRLLPPPEGFLPDKTAALLQSLLKTSGRNQRPRHSHTCSEGRPASNKATARRSSRRRCCCHPGAPTPGSSAIDIRARLAVARVLFFLAYRAVPRDEVGSRLQTCLDGAKTAFAAKASTSDGYRFGDSSPPPLLAGGPVPAESSAGEPDCISGAESEHEDDLVVPATDA